MRSARTHGWWHKYNEKLINRGRIRVYGIAVCMSIVMDARIARRLEKECREMNRGKTGRGFRYPEQLIEVMMYLYEYIGTPYRQTQGLAESMFGKGNVPSYSTIFRRMSKLDRELCPVRHIGDMTIAVDSTGIKITDRGDWMRHKHGTIRKGHIKMHMAAATGTNLITAVSITDEHSHDSGQLVRLAEDSMRIGSVKKILADGAYDTARIFEYARQNGIKLGVPVRKNSRPDTASRAQHGGDCATEEPEAVEG